jgi:hypothetical protein
MLSAATRTYTESGISTGTQWDRIVSAVTRAYAESGIDAAFQRGIRSAVDVGSFVVDRLSAVLTTGGGLTNYVLQAIVQTYELIGAAAGLIHIDMDGDEPEGGEEEPEEGLIEGLIMAWDAGEFLIMADNKALIYNPRSPLRTLPLFPHGWERFKPPWKVEL